MVVNVEHMVTLQQSANYGLKQHWELVPHDGSIRNSLCGSLFIIDLALLHPCTILTVKYVIFVLYLKKKL